MDNIFGYNECVLELKREIKKLESENRKLKKEIKSAYEDDEKIISFSENFNRNLNNCYQTIADSIQRKNIPNKFQKYYLGKINGIVNGEVAKDIDSIANRTKIKNRERIEDMEETIRKNVVKISDLNDQIRCIEAKMTL